MLDTRIAMVQMNSRVGETDRNIARIDRFLQRAAAQGVDIVCFPELSVSGYNAGNTSNPVPEPVPGPSTEKLEALARKHRIWFLAGILERSPGGVVYNRQVVFTPDGVAGAFRKMHVPTSEIGTWAEGDDVAVFDHPKIRFGIEICFDSHFPELSTALAEMGAEIIFLPHASGRGEDASEKKERWLRYMPARAYDNNVFVAVCNQVGDTGAGRAFTGVTFVCDPRGRVIAEGRRSDREEMVVADLEAAVFNEARSEAETFFRHFRRPALYAQWAAKKLL
ncbi:MAG: nitrilase [Gemmatimonadetes bacterium]|nr:nitrilase [Gemmatimonadota bacterium]